jgi:beta-lactam-binding protein with PASTA domain
LATVDIVIARLRELKVPLLLNLQRAGAETLIQQSGLKLGDVREEPSSWPSRTVIWQSPAAEILVDVGTSVDLLLASG